MNCLKIKKLNYIKFLRLGLKGKEIPAIIDSENNYRNLSSLIDDFKPSTLNFEIVEKIKNLIDNLMFKMQHIECNLGIDSTKKELKKAKKEQLILLSKIKEYDVVKYDKLKPLFDDAKGI